MTSFESIEPSKIHLSMPKFDFSYEKKLNEQLKTMGMTDAFDPDMADFSGISDENIYISFVKQNTFIELDEEGTEAAAVTTIGMAYTSANLNQLIINKPFIFSIRERTTNTLLFIGKVEMP
jgi:serpin B